MKKLLAIALTLVSTYSFADVTINPNDVAVIKISSSTNSQCNSELAKTLASLNKKNSFIIHSTDCDVFANYGVSSEVTYQAAIEVFKY